MSYKKINNNKNKTRKKNNIYYPNLYESFEKNVEELFKKKKINISNVSYNLEKEVVKDLSKAVSLTNIKPNNDYYSYINERWINDIDIDVNKQYLTQIDDFRIVQDKVYRELVEIIEEYIKNNKSKFSICLNNAYESLKINNTLEQTRSFTVETLNYIDQLRISKNNLWKLLAYTNMNEIISWASPFSWSINPDDKNPKKYKCYIEPPQVTLLDLDIYYDFKNDTEKEIAYKKKYRNRYFKYLNDLFEIAFGEDHGFDVKNVFECEKELLNAMSCNYLKNADNDENYNVITRSEALEHFNFNWEELCLNMGFKNVPNEFVTSNVNYLLCGTKLLQEKWDNDAWRTYWIYIFIKQQCRWNEKGRNNYFEFEGNFLRGQQTIVDKNIVPVFGIGFMFNTLLTNQYILKYKNDQAIEYVKKIADDLKVVFMRILKRNKWMEPKTKKIALDKLNSIKLQVGSPPKLREDPILNYDQRDPYGNLTKMALWRHKQAIKLVDKDVIDIPVIDWSEIPPKFVSTQAYVVNAMYTPTENTIYIPLGYIQKPFVDLDERGLEYNLAHIGFTIAHEMSHALDDLGSLYDKEGKLNNWWTEKDRNEFYKIQKNIVSQYEAFALRDGIKFDAWPSIGEDLADISGFGICQEYLRDFQLKNNDILPIQSLSFETFFVYFALQSRQKISKKAILAQLKTNPHPLDKYRCNIPLSRSRIFRAIYNVKKNDKMWWNSPNSVWSD